MIVRRLAESLKGQNWSTFSIEILVVVIGILIGLQVDDFVSAQKDRRDERLFLERLHSDILLADQLTQRARDRRLDMAAGITSAVDVLFDRAERDELTATECSVIGLSNVFNVNVASIPAYEELIGTGRLRLVSDLELRSGLVRLEQSRVALSTLLAIQSSQSTFVHLPGAYPDLLRMSNYIDEKGEVRVTMECDLEGMRSNQRFLNQWAVNADGFDAFIRDGLRPWYEQFQEVHRLVDEALGKQHLDGAQGET